MTFYVENESCRQFDFEIEEAVGRVIEQALELEQCPYEAEVNVLITSKEQIRIYNKEYRNIDKETDVLSFPSVDYAKPADFSIAEANQTDYFNPDTGELMLGDIILCADRVFSQAEEFGHSILREFSFLIAHSMLHLLGYDHIEPDDEKDMIMRQKQIMDALHITREKE
jgi:probable rRNA maturation factor